MVKLPSVFSIMLCSLFSNGRLDPWSGGGILTSLSDTITAIMIEDGAHHLDLRAKNRQDPHSVIVAREQEVKTIKKWIEEAKKRRRRVPFWLVQQRRPAEHTLL